MWGGAAAAFRLVEIYRSDRTVVHLEGEHHSLVRDLRAQPDAAGNLVILGPFGNLDWKDNEATADPLLVYSELLCTNDERAHEEAEEVLSRYLKPMWARS